MIAGARIEDCKNRNAGVQLARTSYPKFELMITYIIESLKMPLFSSETGVEVCKILEESASVGFWMESGSEMTKYLRLEFTKFLLQAIAM